MSLVAESKYKGKLILENIVAGDGVKMTKYTLSHLLFSHP